jgi:hypothetical protein
LIIKYYVLINTKGNTSNAKRKRRKYIQRIRGKIQRNFIIMLRCLEKAHHTKSVIRINIRMEEIVKNK